MRTTSMPSRSAFAAPRRWTSVSAGQSVPMISVGPLPATAVASIREPRSPLGWGLRVMRVVRATSSRNESCPVSGVHHIVTGPTSAASAVVTARSVRRSCSAAAACAPIVEMRRVLANPGTGAFAMIAIDTALLLLDGGIAVAPCELSGISTKKVRKPQAPHQKYCAERPMFLPAPGGRGDTRANAKRLADALELDRECNVFHQCD